MLIETDYSALARAGQDGLPLRVGGCVVAIGNFDGVHKGHQALLAHAKALADQDGVPLVALTFDPHPRRYFKAQQPPFLLTDTTLRAEYLAACGVETIVQMRFDMLLANATAEEFIEHILLHALQVKHVVVGNNFVFGKDRGGNVKTLRLWGEKHGFTCVPMAQVTDAASVRLSSQYARDAIKNGQTATAEDVLGRPWVLRGKVVRGEQRGRTIGWPTANIALDEFIHPKFGIYAARVTIEGEEGVYDAVLNIGIRPMFALATPLLEVHLLDTQQNLYDKILRVHFHDFIRAEADLPNLHALKAQIADDAAAARRILQNRDGLGIIQP